VPTTLDEYVANGGKLAQALPGVSGVYFPGKDWYNALPFIWENGGEIAVQKDGKWDAQMSSDASVKGIEQVQQLMTTASLAPKDGDETEAWVPFRTEKAATLSAPSWAYWSIVADENKADTALTKTRATTRCRARTAAPRRCSRVAPTSASRPSRPTRARQERAGDHAQRRLPDAAGQGRPRARQEVSAARSPRRLRNSRRSSRMPPRTRS
jgi:hypothetical protein